MRRPSIPFEAIGPGYRRRLKALDVGISTQSLLEKTMSDPKNPNQIPPGDLSDAVGDPPSDFVEDGEELDVDDEEDLDDSDDEVDDETGLD